MSGVVNLRVAAEGQQALPVHLAGAWHGQAQVVAGPALGVLAGVHVADVAARPEQLTLDVEPVLGDQRVHLGQDAGDVVVDVEQAARAGRLVQVERGQVHAERRGALPDVADQLPGHEVADVLLCLLRRPADVGGEDHVGKTPELGLERLT